jgi:hypothetical protein
MPVVLAVPDFALGKICSWSNRIDAICEAFLSERIRFDKTLQGRSRFPCWKRGPKATILAKTH